MPDQVNELEKGTSRHPNTSSSDGETTRLANLPQKGVTLKHHLAPYTQLWGPIAPIIAVTAAEGATSSLSRPPGVMQPIKQARGPAG